MRIEVKGRNLPVTDELRECVRRRFENVGKQVSDLAVLAVDVWEERVPGDPNRYAVEATLRLKGTTLRAKSAGRDSKHAINLVGDDMGRQVKRHRDKRRNRREARVAGMPPGAGLGDAAPPPSSLPAM